MRIAATKPLFAWDCLEDSPSLTTIKTLLAAIPDAQLLDGLRQARGHGRDDYPVHVLWGVVLLTIALRHPTFEACLGELRRNEALRRLIGIECEQKVPRKWNLSRFLDVLGQEPHLTRAREAFDTMIQRLGSAVPDLGKRTAGDATALHARRKENVEQVKAEQQAGLPQPNGARKEYFDDKGAVTKVYEWFGYKLHLIVDVKHEVALAYQITSATTDDAGTLPATLCQAQANLPQHRMETLAFDKAADNNDTHRLLAKAKIKPLIEIRSLWKEEPERMLPGHDGGSNIVYDEAGTLYCYLCPCQLAGEVFLVVALLRAGTEERVGGAGGGASSPCSPARCGRKRNALRIVTPDPWQDARPTGSERQRVPEDTHAAVAALASAA
jgi:hypothetical protein